jgi:hypothetical protein
MNTKEHIELMFMDLFKFSKIENCLVTIVEGNDVFIVSPLYKGNYSIRKRDQVKKIFDDLLNWVVDSRMDETWNSAGTLFNMEIYSNISEYEINWALKKEKELIEKRRRLKTSTETVNKYSL